MENFLSNLIFLSIISFNPDELYLKFFSQIAKKYFVNETVLIIYSNKSIYYWDMKFFVDFNIFTVEFCNLDLVDGDDARAERGHVENSLILLNDQILSDKEIKAMKSCKSWDGRSKILVLVKNMDEHAVRNLLEKFWALTRAINVTVMSTTAKSVKFYTLQPYRNLITEEFKIENLFPNKIPKNFNGSVIYAVTVPAEPYVILPKGSNNFDGIEARIMNEISKRLNFVIKYVKLPSGENPWYTEKINNRWTGLLGLIHRLEGEILYRGLSVKPDRYLFADVVAVHTVDKLSWLTPVYPFILDWKGLFIIFKIQMWALIVVFLILLSIIVYYLTKPGHMAYTWIDGFFQVLAGLLSAPIFYYHDGYLYRIFMIIFSFYNLIIISSYQSSLITFLTTPGEGKQYKTLDEAVDDGLVAGFFKGVIYNTSDDKLFDKIYAPGKHVYARDFMELLGIIHYNKTMYVRASELFVKAKSIRNFKERGERFVFNKLEDRGETTYMAIWASKGHPLLDLLKIWVMKLLENGLVNFWTHDLLRDEEEVKEGGDEAFPLAVAHLHGIFWICFGLWGLAGVVFFCEIICGKKESILSSLKMSKLKINSSK